MNERFFDPAQILAVPLSSSWELCEIQDCLLSHTSGLLAYIHMLSQGVSYLPVTLRSSGTCLTGGQSGCQRLERGSNHMTQNFASKFCSAEISLKDWFLLGSHK